MGHSRHRVGDRPYSWRMATDDSTPMIWETRKVGRPVGTHYSAGGSSPLARGDDTNKLETHATLGPVVDDDEGDATETAIQVAVGIAIGVVTTIGVIKATPHVKRWIKRLRSKWDGGSEEREVALETASAGVATLSIAEFASEVDAALDEHRTSMSSAEAQKRVLAILMAAAFIADELRALSSAQIEDGSPAELRKAIERLTAPQLTESLNRVLEADASLLDDRTSAELMNLFGGGRTSDGQYVPLLHDNVKEALSLPRAA